MGKLQRDWKTWNKKCRVCKKVKDKSEFTGRTCLECIKEHKLRPDFVTIADNLKA